MTFMFTKESKFSKLLAKSALVSLLAFSAGTGSVLASESTATTSSDPANVSVTQITAASLQADTTLNESETETPDLLPGDFFYFVKTMYENIQLALTVNDVKEARLLTAFAQERLAEANALLTQGKTEEAKLSLQKSLEIQQSAVQKTDQASGTSTTVTTTQADATAPIASATATATVAAAQPGSEQADSEKSDAEEVAAPVKKVKNQEQVLKIKTDLQHNIVALASALEKVKNPKAQLALMKNIEKSFAHLDKKLSKMESKAKLEQTNENVTAEEEQTPAATQVQVPVSTPAPIEPASVQVEQEISVDAKADQKKKGEAKPETNKSAKAKVEKNVNQLNGDNKGNDKGNGKGQGQGQGQGQDKNKGGKPE